MSRQIEQFYLGYGTRLFEYHAQVEYVKNASEASDLRFTTLSMGYRHD